MALSGWLERKKVNDPDKHPSGIVEDPVAWWRGGIFINGSSIQLNTLFPVWTEPTMKLDRGNVAFHARGNPLPRL